MVTYIIGQKLTLLDREPQAGEPAVVLLTSEELDQHPVLAGLETTLHHLPPARDARVCKAEVRRDCLCGMVATPRRTREGERIAFGYLLTERHLALCDDSGAIHALVKRLAKEKRWQENGPGRIFYELLELLVARDLHHLAEMEDYLTQMEDRGLSGELEGFNAQLRRMRRDATGWFRYYTQLEDVACELEKNEGAFFTENELRLFHMLERRLGRLRDEAQLLREYCLQVRELFQAEIDIRQNRIMKILTIVTTICLPLSLLAGWYGMNFTNMPELSWKYGYPAVIAASVLIVAICLWIMKKKKFW